MFSIEKSFFPLPAFPSLPGDLGAFNFIDSPLSDVEWQGPWGHLVWLFALRLRASIFRVYFAEDELILCHGTATKPFMGENQ